HPDTTHHGQAANVHDRCAGIHHTGGLPLDPEAPHDGQAVYPHLDVVGDDDVDPAHDRPDPDGGLLFDEAGLTKIQFDPAHDRPGHVGLGYHPLTRAVRTTHHGKGHGTA